MFIFFCTKVTPYMTPLKLKSYFNNLNISQMHIADFSFFFFLIIQHNNLQTALETFNEYHDSESLKWRRWTSCNAHKNKKIQGFSVSSTISLIFPGSPVKCPNFLHGHSPSTSSLYWHHLFLYPLPSNFPSVALSYFCTCTENIFSFLHNVRVCWCVCVWVCLLCFYQSHTLS